MPCVAPPKIRFTPPKCQRRWKEGGLQFIFETALPRRGDAAEIVIHSRASGRAPPFIGVLSASHGLQNGATMNSFFGARGHVDNKVAASLTYAPDTTGDLEIPFESPGERRGGTRRRCTLD